MKIAKILLLSCFVVVLSLVYGPAHQTALAQSGGGTPVSWPIMQVSTYDYFAAGNYDGIMTIGDLHHYGTFGLGTFDKVDGEMVELDGKIYQIRADGKPTIADDSQTTPFAIVAGEEWTPIASQKLTAGENTAALDAEIDKAATDQNVFVAIRIHGTFSTLQLRSENPAQSKPYPILTNFLKGQIVFNFTNIKGTLVGIRSPAFAKGLNVVGYHFHFISDDLQAGGHVLAVTTGPDDTLQFDDKPVWNIYLPETNPNFQPGQAATMPATASATQAATQASK